MSTEILVEIPDSAEMGRLIGKNGLKKKKLEEELRSILHGCRPDLFELILVVETKPSSPANCMKLFVPRETPDEKIDQLMQMLEKSVAQSCSIPQSQLRSTIAEAKTSLREPHVAGDSHDFSSIHTISELIAKKNFKYIDEIAQEYRMDRAVLERTCDTLGISELRDFALLTDSILKENLFLKELSWLKPVDKIKLENFCKFQRAQLQQSETDRAFEEQDPKIFSSFSSYSGRLLRHESADSFSSKNWRPYACGPQISIQKKFIVSPSTLQVILTHEVTGGVRRNLEDNEGECMPPENSVYALVPLLCLRGTASQLCDTVCQHLRRAFELAFSWRYSKILFKTSSELVSEWRAHGCEGLLSRAYLREATQHCKRLAFGNEPPVLNEIIFLTTEVGNWEALQEELDGMDRVARGQGLFTEATHSVPLELDTDLPVGGSEPMPTGRGDSRSCYDATSTALRERDQQGYKAGGVMFVRVNAGRVEVLLCVERRTLEGTVVMTLGGQRESHETEPCETAVREFCEEVGRLVPRDEVLSAVRHATTRRLWVGFGRYVLYVASAANKSMRDLLDSLPERYDHLHMKPFSSEADHLVWVSWNHICAAVSSQSPKQIPLVPVRVGRRSGLSSLPVSKFLQRLSTVPLVAEAINAVSRVSSLNKEDLIKRLIEETETTQELLHRSDDSLARELLGDTWKLKLEAPHVPPCSIFKQLTATCDSFQRFKAALPPHFAQRVVGIRSIHFACRQAEFCEARNKLVKEGKEFQETEPLFHGTPERWRASAIATHGFNTTIMLNGRAFGNGVYTSSDPQVCQGYAKTAGSILWLKGLVSKDTKTNPPVVVFTDPKHVIPKLIADLSEKDISEQQICQEADRLRAEKTRQHEEEKREFEFQEMKFKQDVIERWRSSARIYIKSMERTLQFLIDVPSEAAAPASSRNCVHSPTCCPWTIELLQMDREAFQFKSRLPIYPHKWKIIDAVKSHHVTILTADTGSGKSTQLPQYLLDHVLPCTKSRIAVLQPRRVNAVALAARVSSERNGEVGGEAGYRLGRGEARISDETRIEFMTHGLFVQIAQDAATLIKNYSAIILDEAHERSVDIDLSLGLLRNAFLHAHSQKAAPIHFKVVVMSATISPEQVQTFRRHLTPVGEISCSILDLPGHTFPVRIMYRGDLQPDPAVIGTGVVGSILGDYATELALDLLQKTLSGHILVFMPGESSIERALRSSMLILSKQTKASESLKTTKNSCDIFQLLFGASTEHNAESENLELKNGGFVVSVVTDEKDSYGVTVVSKSAIQGSQRKRLVRVGFYPFHGKLTGIERDRVLKPRDDRMVVFATNVAETGLTIPNVRYVIDTGLERRVVFEADTGLSKMVTTTISQSSMKQRAGRAGRVASGVCIRLYSEVTAKAFPQSDPLEVEGTPVLSTALKLAALGSSICLPDPINPEQLHIANNALRGLGAVDDDGQLTAEVGQPLLKLGLDLRLGRFLLACDRFGCIEHGVRLAAIIATDAQQRLLPVRVTTEIQAQAVQSRFGDMLDKSGDHLTLIHIMINYEKAHQKIEWCKQHGFDYASLYDAQQAKLYLLEVLAQLRLRLHNDNEKINSNAGWQRAILRCLCAAYCDQLAVVRTPGDCKQGFVRLLDEESKSAAVSSIDQFNLAYGRQPKAGDIGIEIKDRDQQVDINAHQPRPSRVDVRISPCNTSALWTLSNLKTTERSIPNGKFLVVFNSAMLTDTRPEIPQANVMSYVSAQDVQEGAPSWCREADFGKLYESAVRHTGEYPLPPNASSRLLKDYGKYLSHLRQRFPSICLNLDKEKNLITFSAPEGIIMLVKEKLDRLVSDIMPEYIEISIPAQVDMAEFIGKGGQHKNELENELKILAKEAGADPDSLKLIVVTVPTNQNNVVKLQLEGSVKAIAGALIGRIKSDLIQACKISVPQLFLGNTVGAVSASLQANPRMIQLSTSVLPQQWTGRDGAMLQLAHIVIWKCKCSVYGGFVRDWVVRGKSAVDIDVLVQPGETEKTAAALRSAAVPIGLVCSSFRTKGASRSLTFSDPRFDSPIDVDLVDPDRVPFMSPGVDADIDNIQISSRGVLGLKVPNAARSSLPLAKCVKHALRCKFVFFYQLDVPSNEVAVNRLRKLLAKNFVCLSPIPPAVIRDLGLSAEQQRLIQPKPKYSQAWWNGAQ